MRMVYGTGNPAKLKFMRRVLSGLPVEIIGLGDVLPSVPQVDETGNDPLENAAIKAVAYYQRLKIPVFSCDSGLYIEGLPDSMQPGVHVRTVAGRYLTDEEMVDHYASIANRCGGRCIAQYRNAICLILNKTTVFRYMGDDISGEKFILSGIPHSKRRKGFPLDSLSIHIASGRYYFDMSETRASSASEGFRKFFCRALSL